MKIGVSAKGGSLDAEVDPRFGRCAYCVVVDSTTMHIQVHSNPAADLPGGAGPQTVQTFVEMGAEIVLTGHVGPNAQEALDAAKLEAVTDVGGKVRQAVEAYLAKRQ